MLEVFASAGEVNDKVLEKLESISKKVILLFNYNLLNNYVIDFLTIFHRKLIVQFMYISQGIGY